MHSKLRINNTVFIAIATMILVCLGACAPKHSSYSEFQPVPQRGWLKNTAMVFKPVYYDSTCNYNVKLALRHNAGYHYRNLCLNVKYFLADSTMKEMNYETYLYSEKGVWKSPGFGPLFQREFVIAENIPACEVERIMVKQTMETSLEGITDVGIIFEKVK